MRKRFSFESLEGRLLLTTTPNDPSYAREWGLLAVAAGSAWDTTTGSPSVVVADIDTGVDYRHIDLYQNIWINQGEIPSAVKKTLADTDKDGLITFYDLNAAANKGKVTDVDKNGRIDAADLLTRSKYGGWVDGADEGKNGYVDDIIGWDFANNDNNPLDYDGHGTHTAGTIAASGNNGTGVAGMDWRVSLMSVKIFDDNGNSASDSAIAAAIRYSADNGARVSNNSWGGGGFSQAIYNSIAYAGSKGQLFVVAAGNDSANLDSSFFNDYPSEYALDNILVVGATNSSGGMASYSNYGKANVDVFAPGSNVLSTYLNNGYETMSGTSMSTPHVTGAIALMLAANGKLTAAQLKSRVIAGADQSASLVSRSVAGGELNVANAIAGTTGARYTAPPTSSTPIFFFPGRRRWFSLPDPTVPVVTPPPVAAPTPAPTPVPVPTPAPALTPTPEPTPVTVAATVTIVPPAATAPLMTAASAREAATSAIVTERGVTTAAAVRPVFSDRRVIMPTAGYAPAAARSALLADLNDKFDGRLAHLLPNGDAAPGGAAQAAEVGAVAASSALGYASRWSTIEAEIVGATVTPGRGEGALAAVAAVPAELPRLLSLNDVRRHATALAASLAVAAAGLYAYVRNRRLAAARSAGEQRDGEGAEPVEFRLKH